MGKFHIGVPFLLNFKLLLFLFFTPLLVNSLSSLNDDVLGLLVFKSELQDPYGKLTSWSEEDDSPCNWVGLKCNPESNRVTEMVLDGFGLSGRLGRGVLQLQFLQKLSLSSNNLTGSISFNFAQLPDLGFVDLSENDLSGSIPTDFFSKCGSLSSISLARNKFSGAIPESVGSCSTTLGSVNLSGNQFSGELPLGLWSLSQLRSLDLSDNVLEGEVSDGIGSCLLLKLIDLSGNSLSGSLPGTIQKLSLCTDLVLGSNRFTGEVPEWIGEMSSIEVLDLSENNFTGRVPDSFGKLRSLKSMNVSRNALTGILPEAMSNCVDLLVFDVSHNYLTGNFPSWVLNLGLQQIMFSDNGLSGSLESAFVENSPNNIVILDVSQNRLSGEIPSAIGEFGSLQYLSLARNELLGSIPASIGHLKDLHVLDLSDNLLNGSIPSVIGNCASLVSLSIADNQITGSIPESLSKLTHLQIVDFSTNKLTGPLPKQLANLEHLQTFNISHNQLQGELPGGGFFNTISPSSVSGNPSICGASVNRTCTTVVPKPIVLDPSTTDPASGTISQSIGRKKKILSISALIAIGAAIAIVIGVIAITVLNLRVRTESHSPAGPTFDDNDIFSRSPSTDGNSGKLVMFSGDPDFSTETHSLLNKDCELGRGGFGAVYQTTLGDGRTVAIKKLTVSSLVKSQYDFEREVKKLAKVQDSNIVMLEGYYWAPSLQLLIYEYVSGGTLYKRLHDGENMSWNERLDIILGVAKGLAHLHRMNIIHYNVKSSNILLDGSSGEPKVADYGLANLLPMLDRYILSSKIQSALGYMAPEFACKTVKITEKCDVYGFGVLLLEVVTGKRPVEYMDDDIVVLCDMVREALDNGRVDECVDGKLEGVFPVEEAIPVIKLGLVCTLRVPSKRPDMAEVVNILEVIRCSSDSQDEFVRV